MGINSISGFNMGYSSSWLIIKRGGGLMGNTCSSEEEAIRKSLENPGRVFIYNGHAYKNGKMI